MIAAPQARVGIVSAGKAHADLMEVLRRLEITPAMLDTVGVRLLKLGLTFPIETTGMRAFAQGLQESWWWRRRARSSKPSCARCSTTRRPTSARCCWAKPMRGAGR